MSLLLHSNSPVGRNEYLGLFEFDWKGVCCLISYNCQRLRRRPYKLLSALIIVRCIWIRIETHWKHFISGKTKNLLKNVFHAIEDSIYNFNVGMATNIEVVKIKRFIFS